MHGYATFNMPIVRGNCDRETSVTRRNKIVQEITQNVANIFSFLYNNSDRTCFFNALTFDRSLRRCWKPRPPASVFNTSLGTWRMLLHKKPCLIPIIADSLLCLYVGYCNCVVVFCQCLSCRRLGKAVRNDCSIFWATYLFINGHVTCNTAHAFQTVIERLSIVKWIKMRLLIRRTRKYKSEVQRERERERRFMAATQD